jgi:hypothetical protein
MSHVEKIYKQHMHTMLTHRDRLGRRVYIYRPGKPKNIQLSTLQESHSFEKENIPNFADFRVSNCFPFLNPKKPKTQ